MSLGLIPGTSINKQINHVVIIYNKKFNLRLVSFKLGKSFFPLSMSAQGMSNN